MFTKSEIAVREAVRHIVVKAGEHIDPPFTVFFSEIVRVAAARSEQIYPSTLGKVADNICNELRVKGIITERRRPPNACFFVVRVESF